MKRMHLIAAVLITATGFVAVADDAVYTLSAAPQKAADWTDPAFWSGSVPPSGGTAVVVLPDGFVAKADDASIATLNGYKVIRPGVGAELVVDIANDVDLTCAVTADTDVRVTTGTLVKRGVGCLSLRSLLKVPYCDEKKTPYATRQWDYDVNLRIEAGALKMQERTIGPNGTDAVSIHYYGDVDVWADGVLFPGSAPGVNPDTETTKYNENCIKRLTGSGLVTNDVTGGSFCRLKPYHVGAEPAVFSGRLDGKIYFYCGGHQYLTGTASQLIGGGFRVYDNSGLGVRGILGVQKIGYNHGETSSLGRYDSIALGESGARLLYLGTGETTIKSVLIGDSGKNFPAVIDAGATGGIVFVGTIETREANTVHRLHFDGSNAVPCQVKCSIDPKQGLFHVAKKGTGTWLMKDVGTRLRDAVSGYTVENGTLQFETIAEKGVNCSLGKCDLFTEDRWCKVSEAVAVPYCFRLGTDSTTGTLEYVGAEFARVTTRPIGLGGAGRLVNSGVSGGKSLATYFDSGVSAVNGKTDDLILGGTNEKENTITKVTDGNGQVRVVKDGTGSWVLGGDANTFTGGIDVRAGKLTLRAPTGKFTWFRWTIRQDYLQYFGVSEAETQVTEFGLFDKDGYRVNGGLKQAADYKVHKFTENLLPMLQPGEVCYGRPLADDYYIGGEGKQTLDKLFDDVNTSASGDYNFSWHIYDKVSGVMVQPSESDPSTWIPVVMRLDPSANEVASYDICSMLYGNRWRNPKSYTLEGSTDGVNWVLLDDVTNLALPSDKTDYQWLIARTTCPNTGDAAFLKGGKAIKGFSDGAVTYHGPVSVAAGAVLQAEGNVKIESLKVDMTQAGTIRGVEMSAGMVLDLDNVPTGGGALTLPLTIEDCPGAATAVWTVKRGGRTVRNWSAELGADGKLHVFKSGMALIVR